MDDPRPDPPRTLGPARGFVRHDLMILLAVICLTLVVVVPQASKHGLRGALLALLGVAGVLAAGVGLLISAIWLFEQASHPGSGWRGSAFRGLGHLSRFSLFGLVAAILGTALLAGHDVGVVAGNWVSLTCGLLGGAGGCHLHGRLGPARFWIAFRRFGLALLGSFIGGILGILGPENWGVGLGILIPLLVFAVLAATGHIVPKREDVPPPS